MMLEKLYSKLHRRTTSTFFIPQIDGLRFMAIFMVVLYHVNTFVITKAPFIFKKNPLDFWWLYQLAFTDSKGVLLFFVISGFILALPFAKNYWQSGKPILLKDYFFRRITRLEPPYIVVMLLSFFVLKFYKGHDFLASFSSTGVSLPANLGASLIYAHNIIYPKIFSVNPVAWSLEIEVQFYLLVPLLILILKLSKIKRRTVLIFFICLFVFLQNIYKPDVKTLYYYIQYFLLGFLVLDFYLSDIKIKLNSFITFLLGMASLIFILYIDLHRSFYYQFIFLAALFILCILALQDKFWSRGFSLRPLTIIGGMCYSIYLLHTGIISFVLNKTVLLNISEYYPIYLFFQLILILPVILIACGIFYIFLEKPCMDKNWPIKFWNSLKMVLRLK